MFPNTRLPSHQGLGDNLKMNQAQDSQKEPQRAKQEFRRRANLIPRLTNTPKILRRGDVTAVNINTLGLIITGLLFFPHFLPVSPVCFPSINNATRLTRSRVRYLANVHPERTTNSPVCCRSQLIWPSPCSGTLSPGKVFSAGQRGRGTRSRSSQPSLINTFTCNSSSGLYQMCLASITAIFKKRVCSIFGEMC